MAKKASKSGAKGAGAQMQQPQVSVSAANVKLPEGYRVKRQVTMPTLNIKEAGVTKILRIEDAMRLSTYVDPDPKKAKEKPATICGVTDMESGEVYQFLVPSVVESQLKREYKDDSYVGLTFRISCLGKRPNKRYRDFSIMEVEAAQ